MGDFRWTRNRERAAVALALGFTEEEAAEQASVSDRTIRRWKANDAFAFEVDLLTLQLDVAKRSDRLRIAMQVIRSKIKDGIPDSGKDLLDWLKYAQSETDGVKLDLSRIFDGWASGEAIPEDEGT